MSEIGFLLDTNIVSELRKSRPHPGVAAFVDGLDEDAMYVSALTMGELRKGAVSKMRTDAAMGESLRQWINEVEMLFRDRILSVDASVADQWGRLAAGRSRPIIDTLIAATAMVHGMTLVTRNVADVRDTGVALVDPWSAG
ncbi:type II toxin-antitoxin system VapC family toxin [Prosthecomicrobium pneumaticum]|uniref:Ribonuclease VapC n=1 Tax=Prosthecomicrobium pneumaticum TaxID=81895 RepID=A0A7W9FLQ9_9HYPH|nr:type II toxin-antitoxin system VapC family toxin [Prosthecomicrobium pneumaticum]MBB5752989.1 hypothetical protein [Prosthecomicrobium pneumaticum]